MKIKLKLFRCTIFVRGAQCNGVYYVNLSSERCDTAAQQRYTTFNIQQISVVGTHRYDNISVNFGIVNDSSGIVRFKRFFFFFVNGTSRA